ncbi:unnamed protein product [Ectocarpus sp. 12 AP-2014]
MARWGVEGEGVCSCVSQPRSPAQKLFLSVVRPAFEPRYMAVFYLFFIPRVARRLKENQIGDKMGGQRGVEELADKTGSVFFMRPVRKIYQVRTWPNVTFVQSWSRFFLRLVVFVYACVSRRD